MPDSLPRLPRRAGQLGYAGLLSQFAAVWAASSSLGLIDASLLQLRQHLSIGLGALTLGLAA